MTEDVNKLIDIAVRRYSEGMQKTANNIIRGITPILKDLPTGVDGKLVRGPGVDSAASELSSRFVSGINTGVVWGRLSKFVRDTIEPIDKSIRGSLKAIETDASRALKAVVFERINSTLIPDRITDALLPEAIDSFYRMIGDNSTVDALIKNMKQRLGNRIESFSRNQGATIVQQYARDLNEIYSSQRGLQFVRYAGPKDSLNREFCNVRAQKYFHINEVRSWSSLDWDGKIPSTNAMNIVVLLGGYNCRHILEYVGVEEVQRNAPAVLRRAQRNNYI